MDWTFAKRFAADWIESWNAHDLDRVLSHYADDFEMSSPFITRLVGEPTGTLRGKPAIGAYWHGAMELIPDLKLHLLTVLVGVESITLCYRAAEGCLAAEVFHFGADNKITKAVAHYGV